MSTPADAERRLKAADPVPSGTPKPNTAWSSATLLERIDARSEDMQTQTRPTTPKLEPHRPQRSRRLVAAIGAAAVIAAVLAVTAVIASNDDRVSQYQEAAAAGDARAVLGIFAESYRVGDVDTALRYADPDIRIIEAVAGMEELPTPVTTPGYGWLPGMIAFEAELYGRSEPGASSCLGPNESNFVWCTFTESSDSPLSAVGVPEVTWVARVEDGLIVTLQTPGSLLENMDLERIPGIFEAPLADFAGQADPQGLATECDPAAAFEQGLKFGAGTSGSIVYSEQCGSFLAGFVDDFVAAQRS